MIEFGSSMIFVSVRTDMAWYFSKHSHIINAQGIAVASNPQHPCPHIASVLLTKVSNFFNKSNVFFDWKFSVGADYVCNRLLSHIWEKLWCMFPFLCNENF